MDQCDAGGTVSAAVAASSGAKEREERYVRVHQSTVGRTRDPGS